LFRIIAGCFLLFLAVCGCFCHHTSVALDAPWGSQSCLWPSSFPDLPNVPYWLFSKCFWLLLIVFRDVSGCFFVFLVVWACF
jgi:hypothetical protein